MTKKMKGKNYENENEEKNRIKDNAFFSLTKKIV